MFKYICRIYMSNIKATLINKFTRINVTDIAIRTENRISIQVKRETCRVNYGEQD